MTPQERRRLAYASTPPAPVNPYVKGRAAAWYPQPDPAYNPPVQPPGSVPVHLAQARDASIEAHGYGTPDGRGGYSSAPATGWTPVPIQHNLNPTSPWGSLAGGGARAAGLAQLAAQSAVREIPDVSPFKTWSVADQYEHLDELRKTPGQYFRTNDGSRLPAGVGTGWQPMTEQALANRAAQRARWGAVDKRVADFRAANASRNRWGAPGPVKPQGGVVPPPKFAWKHDQDKMSQSVGFIGHLMSQEGLSPEDALAQLKANYSDQQLEMIAADHSPGWGLRDSIDVLGGGLSNDARQRMARYDFLVRSGIYPPGQKPPQGQAQVGAPFKPQSGGGWATDFTNTMPTIPLGGGYY